MSRTKGWKLLARQTGRNGENVDQVSSKVQLVPRNPQSCDEGY